MHCAHKHDFSYEVSTLGTYTKYNKFHLKVTRLKGQLKYFEMEECSDKNVQIRICQIILLCQILSAQHYSIKIIFEIKMLLTFAFFFSKIRTREPGPKYIPSRGPVLGNLDL